MSESMGVPGAQKAPAPVSCYNCGDLGHFFDACPEAARPVPFGLAAAQAKATSSSATAQPSKAGNGPVVTRFPPPVPVVTNFGPPLARSLGYHAMIAMQKQYPKSFVGPYLQPPRPFVQPQPQQTYGYNTQPSQHQYGYQAPATQQMPLYDQNRQFLGYGAPTAAPVTPMGMQHGQYYGQHYPQQYPQYPQWQGQFGTAYNYAVAQQTGYYPNAYGQPQQYEVQPQKPMVTAHVVEELEEDEVQQNIDRILRESSQSRDPTPHLRQNSQPRKDSNAGLTIVVPDAAVFPGSTTSSTPASEVGTPLGEQGKRDWSYEGNKNHFIPMKECTQYDDLLAFDPEWEESVFEKFVYPKAVQIMSPVALDVSQFPILYAPGTEELQSKYTVGENKAIFNLPIKETKFWESMKHDPAVDEIDYDCQLVKYEDWDEYQQARQAWYISTEIERGVVRNVRPPSRSSKSDHVDKRDDDFRIGTYRRSYHGKKNRGWKGSGSRRQSNASVNSIDISRSRRSSFAAVADPEIRLPVPSRTHTPIPASIAPPVAWKSYDHASVWQHASRDPKDGSCIGEESKNTGDHLESGENKGPPVPFRHDSGYDSHRTSTNTSHPYNGRPSKTLQKTRPGHHRSRSASPHEGRLPLYRDRSEERDYDFKRRNQQHSYSHIVRSRSPLRNIGSDHLEHRSPIYLRGGRSRSPARFTGNERFADRYRGRRYASRSRSPIRRTIEDRFYDDRDRCRSRSRSPRKDYGPGRFDEYDHDYKRIDRSRSPVGEFRDERYDDDLEYDRRHYIPGDRGRDFVRSRTPIRGRRPSWDFERKPYDDDLAYDRRRYSRGRSVRIDRSRSRSPLKSTGWFRDPSPVPRKRVRVWDEEREGYISRSESPEPVEDEQIDDQERGRRRSRLSDGAIQNLGTQRVRSSSRTTPTGETRKRFRSPSPVVESPLSPTSRALLGEIPFEEPADEDGTKEDDRQERKAKRPRQNTYGAAFGRRW